MERRTRRKSSRIEFRSCRQLVHPACRGLQLSSGGRRAPKKSHGGWLARQTSEKERRSAAGASEIGLPGGKRGEGALEREEESGWLQRCGYESVPEWFFWFLVGSRPTGGLTDTGNRARSSGTFLQDFLPWRVSWPVVGVRMRLARLGRETFEGLADGKRERGGWRAGDARGLRDRGKRVTVELLGY